MTLLLADSTKATLAVAGIGFLAVLVGGLVGLAGTLVTTSRQIDRQERDLRRDIYADYVARALEMSKLFHQRRSQYELVMKARLVHNHLVEEALQSYNAGSVDYIKAQAVKARTPALEAAEDFNALVEKWDVLYPVFVSRAHELKIHAPELVHQAAQLIYRAVGLQGRFNLPEHPEAHDLESIALRLFSAVARADARSPDATRWSKARRDLAPKILDLDAEIARVEGEVASEAEPMEVPLYAPVEESGAVQPDNGDESTTDG